MGSFIRSSISLFSLFLAGFVLELPHKDDFYESVRKVEERIRIQEEREKDLQGINSRGNEKDKVAVSL